MDPGGLRDRYIGAVAGAPDQAVLEDVRVSALGKKGEISLKMRKLAQIEVDRKVLADLAVHEPAAFGAIVAKAKAALPA